MRIKDSPKSNAEGGSKKEGKKKSNKQKTESIGSVITNKNEKTSSAPIKTEKENSKLTPAKDETVNEV